MKPPGRTNSAARRTITGGAVLPGEQLAADVQYMDAESAKRATQLIDSWRQMPRADFESSANRL
jgi:hypothetical protein